MGPAIVINTYWMGSSGYRGGDLLRTYDHPTRLDTPGFLGRTLTSVRTIEGPFRLLIVATATDPELQDAAEGKIREVIEPFDDLEPIIFGASELGVLKKRISELGLPEMAAQLSLDGYGSIRNIGLLAASILGFEEVVFLDDDELVAPDFLKAGVEYLGEEPPDASAEEPTAVSVGGKRVATSEGDRRVLGKTGCVLDGEGRINLDFSSHWWDMVWRKSELFSRSIMATLSPPRIKPTTYALGGVMSLHRDLFASVAFDPFVPRGEDADYVINARLQGHLFYSDNRFEVLHLPPPHLSQALGLRQDIYRFVYEQHKLQELGLGEVVAETFDPYPGIMLRSASFKGATTALLRGLRHFGTDAGAHLMLVPAALRRAPAFARVHLPRYLAFQSQWAALVEAVSRDEIMKECLSKAA